VGIFDFEPMSNSELQAQRLELKYIIPERVAVSIRDFLLPYLEMDSFGASQPDCSYPVHSLYLDSPELALYHSTLNGDRNRYKLRIRFYEGRPQAPVYLEIKRRDDGSIYKERCAVEREAVAEIVAGRLPDRRDLVKGDATAERALANFCRHLNQIQAEPMAHVAYRREAWLSEGSNRVRVTMDRQVQSCREPSIRLDAQLTNPITVFGDEVVLELKFTGRFPSWMGDLVRVFNLKQCSAAKYVDGMVKIKDQSTEGALPTVRARRAVTPNMNLSF
jgi:hypothetical protein